MNNISITKFRWSQKTNSILYKLGIFTIGDFNGVSIKALKEMGIPNKTIKQIEDICKVHNIETKDNELRVYRVKAISKSRGYSYDKFIDFIVYTPEEAKTLMIYHLNKLKCLEEYEDDITVVDSVDIRYGVNVTDM